MAKVLAAVRWPACSSGRRRRGPTATTGILIPTMLRGDIVVLPLVGVAFVVPVGISLIALVKRPGERTAKAVLNRSVLLAVASLSLFVLTVWFS